MSITPSIEALRIMFRYLSAIRSEPSTNCHSTTVAFLIEDDCIRARFHGLHLNLFDLDCIRARFKY